MADDAVKHGKTTIQGATGYFKWAANQSETSTVKYIFVAKEKYVSQEELAIYAQGLLTLKGTMKVHCVVGIKQNQVQVRKTSCFWAACCQKEYNKCQMCAGWTEHLLKKDTHDKTTISNDDKDKDKEEPRND